MGNFIHAYKEKLEENVRKSQEMSSSWTLSVKKDLKIIIFFILETSHPLASWMKDYHAMSSPSPLLISKLEQIPTEINLVQLKI